MSELRTFILSAGGFCLAILSLPAAEEPAADQPNPILRQIEWTKGPTTADLKSVAQIQVPEGFMFTGPKGTKKLLEAMGNPTSGSELGFLAPTSLVWFVVFEFSDVGYVKDDDKDKLDAAKMLKSIQAGNEQANEHRKEMGVPPLKITGWDLPPRYNEQTHNLEWAIRGESEGERVVNYNTRLLGRKGVMEVNLVIDPEKIAGAMPAYEALLKDYSYKSGERYAEYKQGDKLAKYGLAALITGGAAAIAVKTGLFASLILIFKKAWKLVVVGVVAVVAFIKKLLFGASTRKPVE
jgi:uncharacterized membrane-anchored protein